MKNSTASEGRWPVLIALGAIGGLYTAMPRHLLPLPNDALRFAPLVVVLLASAPLVWSHKTDRTRMNHVLAIVLMSVLTTFLVASVVLLVLELPRHRETGTEMLRSAASLWATNVLVFACWYWRLDCGGPHERAEDAEIEDSAFLWPQMTLSDANAKLAGQVGWKPKFIDYLFVAFSLTTALSPADTPVLARWAKVLTMIQALISFSVIILLAARAVNILPGN